MTVKVKALYSISKSEHTDEDNDDFMLVGASENEYAASDGATVSMFSREWATVLCEQFCNSPAEKITRQWIDKASENLNEKIRGISMNWFAEAKFKEEGSHATLLGLKLDPEGERFFVTSIGDTCLYFRNNIMGKMLPLDRPELFNNYPHFICSIPDKNTESLSGQINYSGRLLEGKTRFYIMTDALAKWFSQNLLREVDREKERIKARNSMTLKRSLYKGLSALRSLITNEKPWRRLDSIRNAEAFRRFVGDLRRKKEMEDDDTSLMILEVVIDKR